MPAKVRLFISHSSQEDALAREAIATLRQRVDADHIEILLDAVVLETGERWRDELWGWWAECDAAVVVCSEAALQSRWVMIEVAMLMRRHRLSSLPIFPILIHPVTADRVKQALFADQEITELQTSHVWTEDNLQTEADAIAAKLNQLAVLSGSDDSLLAWQERIAALLQKNAVADIVAKAASDLGTPIEAWMPFALQTHVLARALVTAEAAAVKRAMTRLAKALEADCREKVMELVAAAWVPLDDARPIAQIVDRPPGRRAVALPTDASRLAHWYIRRASARYPAWKPVEFKHPVGADDVEEIFEAVSASLRVHLRCDPDDSAEQLRLRLRAKERNREPVFILVPVDRAEPPKRIAAKLLLPLMKRLTDDFPSLSFFVLAGQPPVSLDEAVTSGIIVFLNFDPRAASQWRNDYAEAIDATG